MLLRLIRWSKGYVDFSAKGKFPERFINLTTRNGINVWNLKPTENGLTASMQVYDYKNIHNIAHKSRLKMRVTGRHGLPFYAERYKSRAGLVIGAVMGIILISVLSKFIWYIDAPPTKSLSTSQILSALEDDNVRIGSYTAAIDTENTERKMILQNEQIGWISLNIMGSTVKVNIQEKTPKPDTPDYKTPCNIKAKNDGVITDIKASKGETKVLKGSGVVKGELLVSGIVETKQETIEYVHASAEIMADVIYKREYTLPESYDYFYITDNRTDRYMCSFLNFKFPCSLSFLSYDDSVYVFGREKLRLNNTDIPVELITESEVEVKKSEITLDRPTLEKKILAESVLYEVFEKQDSRLVSRKISTKSNGEDFIAEISYIFNENIAQTAEFSVTE